MRIAFDTFQPPRAPHRAVSVPTTASFLNRIEKPPLAQRISHDDSGAPYVHSPYFWISFSLKLYFLYPDEHSLEVPFATVSRRQRCSTPSRTQESQDSRGTGQRQRARERSRGDKLSLGPKPALALAVIYAGVSGEVDVKVNAVLPRPTSNGQLPPRSVRKPLRSESGTPPFCASVSAQMPRVEGPAALPSTYSSSQMKESRQSRMTSSPTPAAARNVPLTCPCPSTWNVTTRMQHEPKNRQA